MDGSFHTTASRSSSISRRSWWPRAHRQVPGFCISASIQRHEQVDAHQGCDQAPRDNDCPSSVAISAKKDRPMDVGFIGLGHMGAPMARNLLKAGHRVTVYNRTRSKAEALAREGAQVAERVADACHGDVLITMLSDDRAVEDVVFSEGGALNALGRNAIHISMSTISVALSDRLAEAHGKAGQGYVAAPVFGRPEAAAAARLFIIAAGAGATLGRCQPLFDAMGQETFVISAKPSEANLVKLSGNFLIASLLESLGEAFALVRKSGIDPHRYLNVLTSSLFSAQVYPTRDSNTAEDNTPGDEVKMSL